MITSACDCARNGAGQLAGRALADVAERSRARRHARDELRRELREVARGHSQRPQTFVRERDVEPRGRECRVRRAGARLHTLVGGVERGDFRDGRDLRSERREPRAAGRRRWELHADERSEVFVEAGEDVPLDVVQRERRRRDAGLGGGVGARPFLADQARRDRERGRGRPQARQKPTPGKPPRPPTPHSYIVPKPAEVRRGT